MDKENALVNQISKKLLRYPLDSDREAVDVESIGQRIKKRRKELDFTQVQLSERIGVSKGAVGQWEMDDTKPSGKNLLNLAKVLEKSPDWVLSGKEPKGKTVSSRSQDKLSRGPEISHRAVPLISFVAAGDLCDAEDPYPTGAAEQMIDTYIPVAEGMYALRVEGDSMENRGGSPSIPEGMVIIVDPSARAENGSLVIAKDGQGKATFKKLSYDGDDVYLVPLNNKYDPIKIKEELHICGVVVAAQMDFR